jgi:hypothetical protein
MIGVPTEPIDAAEWKKLPVRSAMSDSYVVEQSSPVIINSVAELVVSRI